jgi:hypothetical protein
MSWYEATKDAWATIEKLKNAEANRAMARIQMEGVKLAEENVQLREENMALREALRNRQAMTFRENVFWIEQGGQLDGPYCPRCQDAEGKAVHMIDRGATWKCPNCPTIVRIPARLGDQPDDFPPPRDPIR